MRSGDPARSPGEPSGTPEGQRPNSFTPVHKSRPQPATIGTPWHPQPPDLLPITSPRYTLPSRQVFSYRGLPRTPTPAPSGVGGLNRPAATAADPEKAGARTQRERVERSPNITERNVQLFPNCHLESPWGNEPVRFVSKGGAFFSKTILRFSYLKKPLRWFVRLITVCLFF